MSPKRAEPLSRTVRSPFSQVERKTMKEVICVRTGMLVDAITATKVRNSRLTRPLPLLDILEDLNYLTKAKLDNAIEIAKSVPPKFRACYDTLVAGTKANIKKLGGMQVKHEKAFEKLKSHQLVAHRVFAKAVRNENDRRHKVREAAEVAKEEVVSRLRYQADEMYLDVLTGDSEDMKELRNRLPTAESVMKELAQHGFIPEAPIRNPDRLLSNGN
ncbi:hypothetical protein LCGC14_1926550 [marine sediment metagenome]|uniref:Uncharacterized protein n=1 Tax=marine sediment metagenome TaxID=412755 RepID=A0A0F9FP69_9ZZZZ